MSNECLRLRDDLLLCLNIYRAGQGDQNRINMVTARSAYVNCTRKCRKEYDECQMNNLLQKQHVDAKAFWHLLRSNINVDKTPQLKACDFFQYFKALSNPSDIMYTADDDIYESMQLLAEADQVGAYEELNDAIAEYEVKKAISDLKVGKAAGHDILINELYIKAMDILTPKIVCLFNTVFQSVFFPTSWS